LDLKLNDKIVVVKGAARGIGRAIALEFAREGANVIVNNVIDASETLMEIKKLGKESMFIKTDVSNMNQVKQMFNKVAKNFGRIDVLVNNAGVTRDALIQKMRVEDWDFVLNVNLKGAINCCKCAATYIIEQKYGRIINISSIVGQMGNVGQANYAVSKAGVIGLTKALALELARYGDITVNAVAPGFVSTEMTRRVPEKNYEDVYRENTLPQAGRAGGDRLSRCVPSL